jgi:hypothetical protein
MAGEWTYYPVSTLPGALDVVWCHFPTHLDLSKPGPKPRPALVAETAVTENDEPMVHAIYGTSKLKHDTRPLDFFVSNYQDMHDAGLYQATRFDMGLHIWMPWAEEFFTPPSSQYKNPAIGNLSANSRELLGIILGMRRKAGYR